MNADTRRNNTYLLTIKAFQGLGMPWDPSDPKDPYLPKPTDPTEPTNPENPDIEKEETYMRVRLKCSSGTSSHVMSFLSNISIG